MLLSFVPVCPFWSDQGQIKNNYLYTKGKHQVSFDVHNAVIQYINKAKITSLLAWVHQLFSDTKLAKYILQQIISSNSAGNFA
jgi:predicted HAD superfamily phosphohydrolase YqeG